MNRTLGRSSAWTLACVVGLGCDRASSTATAKSIGEAPPSAHVEALARAVRTIATNESRAAVHVRIGERSHAPTTIEDDASGASVAFVPRFGHDTDAVDREGLRVMTSVANGVDLLRRARLDGVEEYAVVAHAIGDTGLAWTMTLGDRVAGLRLVDDVLELLDSGGAPRLRVPRPFVVDTRGVHRSAHLDVAGCAVDRSPIAPFSRPIVAIGARACDVVVRWDDRGLATPIVVDPAWTSTTAMATARFAFTLTALADGTLLAAGGDHGGGNALAGSEIFDPTTMTWATTSPLNVARTMHAATLLQDGSVAVFGGTSAQTSAERFDPTLGTWTALPTMLAQHAEPTATTLPNGDVLILGGDAIVGACERFTPTSDGTGTFAVEPPMPNPRGGHGAALITGFVIAAGSEGAASPPTVSDEYALETRTWGTSLPMDGPHAGGRVIALGDTVFVVGGADLSGSPSSLVESRAPSPAAWSTSPALIAPRVELAVALTSDGALLAIGGRELATTERFPIVAGALTEPFLAGALSDVREAAAAVGVASGRAIVVGGVDATGVALASVDVYALAATASTCLVDGECANGLCADGVCCDAACVGPCEACDGSGGAAVGHCAAIVGVAKHGACTPAAVGADPCTATVCDGSNVAQCAGFVGASVSCRSQSCDASTGIATAAASCAGNGACPAIVTTPCAPYVCDGDACRTSCRSDNDCVPGFPCDPVAHVCAQTSTCVDGQTEQTLSGTRDCAPFACENGACAATCATSNDCVAPNVCDGASGRCVTTVATPPSSSGSGGCSVMQPKSAPTPWILISLALAFARRLRPVGPRKRLL